MGLIGQQCPTSSEPVSDHSCFGFYGSQDSKDAFISKKGMYMYGRKLFQADDWNGFRIGGLCRISSTVYM